MDAQYFSRCATWYQMKGRLVVNDSRSPNAPRVITMEPWHEIVFSAADGEHTVADLVATLGREYAGGPPAGLREQVCSLIADLAGEGIVRLHESPVKLPPYYAEEYFAEPAAVRKAQMQADGLIPPDVPSSEAQ
jgi:hypothetical protein